MILLALTPMGLYILTMASLQRVRVRGYSYWRIVRSHRVAGKPRLSVLAHLGKADDLLIRLQAADSLRIKSLSHGAVAALLALARELDLAGTIDRHLASVGRRDRHAARHLPDPGRSPERHAGLSVGQTFELGCVGRACHATSKRAFADWARSTTLGEITHTDVDRLSSQHFWDQMDQLPVEILATIEREIVGRALECFDLKLDTVLYDATNFFTFIDSINTRPKLPARGHNKQKRHDLRQLGVALLCTREEGVPLFHRTYGGEVHDARSFADLLPTIRDRLVDMGRDLQSMTLVYDKGNVSQANQQGVDTAAIHYVASLAVSNQRPLIAEANSQLASLKLSEEESVQAYRTRRKIWGAERTVVVVVSESFRAGQLRGVLQHIAAARKWLDRLADTVARGKQRRSRAAIERDIQTRLMGRQHLQKVIRWELTGDKQLSLKYEVDAQAVEELSRDVLGRLVLMTDRDAWSTEDIIRTYRGQAHVEAVFAHLKDPVHVMLRPQYHWTDQKLQVHVFMCVAAYLLARLLHLRAQRAGYCHSQEALLDSLAQIRKATVIRTTSKKALRVSTQLEDIPPELQGLVERLGIAL
jgi:transposase